MSGKYFQYLALLFTEIYLDRYFRDPREMLVALNKRIADFNEDLHEADRIAPIDELRGIDLVVRSGSLGSARGRPD